MTAEPSLFATVAPCPATREAVVIYERAGASGCPLCGAQALEHYPEDADVIRDDGGDLGPWMMSLPRTP